MPDLRKNKLFAVILVSVLFLFVILEGLLLRYSMLTMEHVTLAVVGTNQTAEEVSLPYRGDSSGLKRYLFAGKMYKGFLKQDIVHITPDDCLVSMRVGGQELPLDDLLSGRLDDWNGGFDYRLGSYLAEGWNDIEITIEDSAGKYGVSVDPSNRDVLGWIIKTFLVLTFLAAIFLLLRLLGMRTSMTILILVGIALRLSYMNVTPPHMRSHDSQAHMEYIHYIADYHRLPKASEGWAFYHPPVYYITGAVILDAMRMLGIQDQVSTDSAMEFYSFLLSIVFLLTGIRIIELTFGQLLSGYYLRKYREIKNFGFWKKTIPMIACTLFVLWPSNIVHSVRIGNDSLLYVLYALSFYFILRWVFLSCFRDLVIASVFTALALLTKTSALILFGIIGVYVLADIARRKFQWKAWLNYWPVALILGAAFLLAFGGGITARLSGSNVNLIVGNAGNLNSGLFVGNHAGNYLYFDTKIFLTEPFTEAWDDAQGRQYFWNYLFKTGLFGQFLYPGDVIRNIAILISFLFLFVLGIVAYGALLTEKFHWKTNAIHFLNVLILLISAVLFRIQIPASCSNDFRYILPLLISFTYLAGFSLLEFLRRNRMKLFYFSCGVFGLFTVFSGVFILLVRNQ
jgi:hypothetical protein